MKTLLPFLFACSHIAHCKQPKKQIKQILCAEIGGTRIKAAVLPINPTFKQLQQVKVITMPSKEWTPGAF